MFFYFFEHFLAKLFEIKRKGEFESRNCYSAIIYEFNNQFNLQLTVRVASEEKRMKRSKKEKTSDAFLCVAVIQTWQEHFKRFIEISEQKSYERIISGTHKNI